MTKKKVLIIGINSPPELTGIGRYSGEMVAWLAAHDYEVTMITAFPYYPQWKVQKPYSGWWYKKESPAANIILYRCPMYVPSKPTGLKRMLHEATFFMSAFFVILKLLFRPGYNSMLAIAPPFHLGFLALFYKFFKGTPVLYHLQDLQVDAAKDLGVLKAGWLFSLLFKLERSILNKADTITTISEGMQKKISRKVDRTVLLFPNWVDTASYYPMTNRKLLKARWGFSAEDKIVMYSGSIGEKQGLEMLLAIAARLEQRSAIKFVICGTGPLKNKLMSVAETAGVKNVFFLPLQEHAVFNEFLNMADVHLVLQKGDAGDLMMPSKLTTILSVGGLAIVTAASGTTLSEVITSNHMGFVVPADSEVTLEDMIVHSCENEHSALRLNARAYAERYLNKDVILSNLTSAL
ncbi:MAG TPA: WcaI family glycosyltransferase [Pedobacter sp.]|nr:WcaI family glycosyltransferase [Pedobacter sp.]